MARTLVIAEKPSVAEDIAAALPGEFKKRGQYLESDEYVVTWAVGHLVQLAEPERYDERYRRWRLADLPIVPERFRLQPIDQRSEQQLAVIHELLRRPDVERVVNACDAGREGELIFAYVLETSGVRKPVERFWVSSLTRPAIRTGFERLRPGAQLAPLEAAARSRAEADWLVGMNATRAATVRNRAYGRGVVSLGRVQTPTLALLVERERAIQAFVPQPYWLVHATFEPAGQPRYVGLWLRGEATRLDSAEAAEAIVAKVAGRMGEVASVARRDQNERPPLLYDLTSLQRDANHRFGFSAARTLRAAQALYEARKAITYPRTASRYLSTDLVPQLGPTAETLLPIPDYAAAAGYVLGLETLPLERVVDDAKVGDHHAIIPTPAAHEAGRLGEDERRVFDLVARRFLAVFHPPARYASTTVTTDVEGETFRSRGRVTLAPGWRAVYGREPDDGEAREAEDDEASGELPPLEQGQAVRCAEAASEAKTTRPPPRYTEATLLSAMETAGRLVEDDQLREALKERGLGTPATRAETIETLLRRGYVARGGRELMALPKGLEVVGMLERHPLTSPELTGDWEQRLNRIEHGEDDRACFTRDIVDFARATVERIAALGPEQLRGERVELGPCPRCGAATGEVVRSTSRGYGCASWKSREQPGCGFFIPAQVARRPITPDLARQLVERGHTDEVLSGFRSKAGKPFRARLVLDDAGKAVFELPGPPRPRAEGGTVAGEGGDGVASDERNPDEEPAQQAAGGENDGATEGAEGRASRAAEAAEGQRRPAQARRSVLSSAAPASGADPAALLAERGFEVVDKRASGGALWVMDAPGLAEALEQLPAGLRFTFAPEGGRATKRRPAWYARAEPKEARTPAE